MVGATQALPVRTWPREAVARRQPHPKPAREWRAGELLQDAGILLAMVYLLPFVILAFGAPIALGLKSLLWLVGAL